MINSFLIASFLFLFSCSHFQQNQHAEILIYPQWHLTANQITTDIEQSLQLPQRENQYFIFADLLQQIEQKQLHAIIAEGCEGEIDQNFSLQYNGWDYHSLEKFALADPKRFATVVSHIPLMMKAKLQDEIRVICGDDLNLIEQQNLAMSDMRAFLGIYGRLSSLDPESKAYQQFAQLLEKEGANAAMAKEQLAQAFDRWNEFMMKRNQQFAQVITETYKAKKGGASLAVVIGRLHADELAELLEQENLRVKVMPVAGLPQSDPVADIKIFLQSN